MGQDMLGELIEARRQCIRALRHRHLARSIGRSSDERYVGGDQFEQAKNIIGQVRNVKDERHMEGPWIDQVLRSGPTEIEVPTGFSCRVAKPDDVIVHATTAVKGGVQPICHWKKGAIGKHEFKSDILTVDSVEKASNQFAGKFWENCQPLLRASLRMKVDRFYAPY